MIRVGIPSWFIIGIRLISPHIPSFSDTARKQFNSRSLTACFYDRNNFIRFSTMFSFHSTN